MPISESQNERKRARFFELPSDEYKSLYFTSKPPPSNKEFLDAIETLIKAQQTLNQKDKEKARRQKRAAVNMYGDKKKKEIVVKMPRSGKAKRKEMERDKVLKDLGWNPETMTDKEKNEIGEIRAKDEQEALAEADLVSDLPTAPIVCTLGDDPTGSGFKNGRMRPVRARFGGNI